MSIEVALFTLAGQGDIDIFVAPKSALDWCMEVRPGQQKLPDNVRAELGPFLDTHAYVQGALEGGVYITPGSADNDAAMYLAGLCRSFDNQRKAVKFIKDQGWTLGDDSEYEGCIY